MTKLIHIGLPKTGLTFFKEEIYGEVSKIKKIPFYKFSLENYDYKNKLNDKFIIANEGMFAEKWDFINLEKNFHKIKDIFDKKTIVLITLRKPSDFLNSIYLQQFKEMNVLKPEKFFYSSINSDKSGYNIRYLDYIKFINLYKSYFEKVIILKYNKNFDLGFLNNIFNLSFDKSKYLESKKKIFRNKSISKNSVYLLLFLSKFIKINNWKQNKFLRNLYKIILRVGRNSFFHRKYNCNINKIFIELNHKDKIYDEIQ